MRIEKIADNRIKVTLTTADLQHLDINIESLTPDSRELHTFLFHIMETIREETDFNPYSGQVVVEATPSQEGISIMVSKMQTRVKKITREAFSKATALKPRLKKKNSEYEMYYFFDFENLCSAMCEMEYEALMESTLYRMDSQYCIVIKHNKNFQKSRWMLNEFADRSSRRKTKGIHVNEHWDLIASGSDMVDMAAGIWDLK